MGQFTLLKSLWGATQHHQATLLGTLRKGTVGDQGLTSEEEERLASHIIDLGAKGFSLTKINVINGPAASSSPEDTDLHVATNVLKCP